MYLHCTKTTLESLDILYYASSYWFPTKAEDKLKEAFSSGGYENVEVIKTYEEFVDDPKVKDSKTKTCLSFFFFIFMKYLIFIILFNCFFML